MKEKSLNMLELKALLALINMGKAATALIVFETIHKTQKNKPLLFGSLKAALWQLEVRKYLIASQPQQGSPKAYQTTDSGVNAAMEAWRTLKELGAPAFE